MNEYDRLNIRQLQELLWERELVPKRWMLFQLKRHEVIRILELNRAITEKDQTTLQNRQKRKTQKSMKAAKDRTQQFGTSKLTPEERLKQAIDTRGPLTFRGMREFEEPFESAAGSRRGKVAVVFTDSEGNDFLLTKGEAEKAKGMGVPVPFHVFQATRKVKLPKTKAYKPVSDYFK